MAKRREAQGADAPGEAEPERNASLPARAAQAIKRLLAERLPAGLYLVATPIGNLADITLRGLSVLARADVVYCEDTRRSRTLLAHFAIAASLRPYHEHNAAAERPRVLAEIAAGRAIALISDAGTPLVSDPGLKLVREALAAGHHVESLPGPSAVLAALTSSGLPTDTFLFAGFLPPRSAARRKRIGELKDIPATLVFFEAPSRLSETLHDLAAVLGPRPGAIARELTKLHEDVRRAPLDRLAAEVGEVLGEVVVLAGPPDPEEVADEAILARLDEALATMSARDAARAVADALGVPKARVYELSLRLKRDDR